MGTAYISQDYHTFQNGLCYELAFDLAEYDTGNQDLGCKVPVLRDSDEAELINPLIAGISFLHPTNKPQHEDPVPIRPRVISVKASSRVADNAINRGQIDVSWSTENADYVQLSYACDPAPEKLGPVINDGSSRECTNAKLHLGSDFPSNRSPNGSQTVGFANFHESIPIEIAVTITPFLHGVSYPNSAFAISINVNPFNPFPRGIPASNGNLTVTYSLSAASYNYYRQGSIVDITWKDALPRHPCVNLYLVHDDAQGKKNYRVHIAGRCLAPASSGSYSWTIPERYLGRSFQIFAATPGLLSTGLSEPFDINR